MNIDRTSSKKQQQQQQPQDWIQNSNLLVISLLLLVRLPMNHLLYSTTRTVYKCTNGTKLQYTSWNRQQQQQVF